MRIVGIRLGCMCLDSSHPNKIIKGAALNMANILFFPRTFTGAYSHFSNFLMYSLHVHVRMCAWIKSERSWNKIEMANSKKDPQVGLCYAYYFHGFRLVFDFSRSVLMGFQGSRLVFQGPRLIFQCSTIIFHRSRWVFIGAHNFFTLIAN